ncbi:hypothetical protein C5S35_05750 [Candidatus Methanophagaceae archaeon]|jgi:hypothetical protein|nr:hypothetical protein C5S35_05750 [Methanophagales archaeon]
MAPPVGGDGCPIEAGAKAAKIEATNIAAITTPITLLLHFLHFFKNTILFFFTSYFFKTFSYFLHFPFMSPIFGICIAPLLGTASPLHGFAPCIKR